MNQTSSGFSFRVAPESNRMAPGATANAPTLKPTLTVLRHRVRRTMQSLSLALFGKEGRLLIAAFIFLLGLTSCSTPPSETFVATGFNERTVMASTLLDHTNGQRFDLAKGELLQVLKEARKIQSARAAIVEPRYVLCLLTGSSFQSQKLDLFVDPTGEGYFRHGTKQPVMFYSPTLYRSLNEVATKNVSKTVGSTATPPP
jgi:hypothetical protein